MSGETLTLIEENNILLEDILSEFEIVSSYLSTVSDAISIITCLIIAVIVIILLHYSYKLIDLFF